MKTFIIPIVALLCLFTSCSYTEEATRDFNLKINASKKDFKDKINLGGAYHNIRKESYHIGIEYNNGKPTKYIDTPYLEKPIFFFNNGLILFLEVLVLDSNNLKLGFKKHIPYKGGMYNWGTYDITHDTVKAIIYISYYGKTASKRIMLLQSNFEGIIRNKDTIIDWHMVSPNPKADSDFSMNKDYVLSLLKYKNLYFKPVPSKQLIDSNNTWLNKYRR